MIKWELASEGDQPCLYHNCTGVGADKLSLDYDRVMAATLIIFAVVVSDVIVLVWLGVLFWLGVGICCYSNMSPRWDVIVMLISQ